MYFIILSLLFVFLFLIWILIFILIIICFSSFFFFFSEIHFVLEVLIRCESNGFFLFFFFDWNSRLWFIFIIFIEKIDFLLFFLFKQFIKNGFLSCQIVRYNYFISVFIFRLIYILKLIFAYTSFAAEFFLWTFWISIDFDLIKFISLNFRNHSIQSSEKTG